MNLEQELQLHRRLVLHVRPYAEDDEEVRRESWEDLHRRRQGSLSWNVGSVLWRDGRQWYIFENKISESHDLRIQEGRGEEPSQVLNVVQRCRKKKGEMR